MQTTTIKRSYNHAIDQNKKNAFLIFSDLSGSTDLSNTDETEYMRVCIAHIFSAVTDLCKMFNIVKTVGDEVMLTEIMTKDVTITSEKIQEIIALAIMFQEGLYNDHKIRTKVAIHFCEDIIDGQMIGQQAIVEKVEGLNKFKPHEGDIFGKEVNYGARMMSFVQGGQLVISEKFFNLFDNDTRQNIIENEGSLNLKYGSGTRKIRFDVPMSFWFKGFERKDNSGVVADFNYQNIIQVLYSNKQHGGRLSLTGFPFKCLSFFHVSDWTPKNHKSLSKFLQLLSKICPNRSYPYLFEIIYDQPERLFPNRLRVYFQYNIAILFQLQSYELYAMLYKMLQNKLSSELISGLSNPIWDGHQVEFTKISDEKSLALWKINAFFAKKQELDEIIKNQVFTINMLGHHDIFTISENDQMLKDLSESFNRMQLVAPDGRISFPADVHYNDAMYNWVGNASFGSLLVVNVS